MALLKAPTGTWCTSVGTGIRQWGELWWEKHNRVLRGQHLRSQASRRF